MKHLSNMLFAFAFAGSVAGSAIADDSQQTTQPRHFADPRMTGGGGGPSTHGEEEIWCPNMNCRGGTVG